MPSALRAHQGCATSAARSSNPDSRLHRLPRQLHILRPTPDRLMPLGCGSTANVAPSGRSSTVKARTPRRKPRRPSLPAAHSRSRRGGEASRGSFRDAVRPYAVAQVARSKRARYSSSLRPRNVASRPPLRLRGTGNRAKASCPPSGFISPTSNGRRGSCGRSASRMTGCRATSRPHRATSIARDKAPCATRAAGRRRAYAAAGTSPAHHETSPQAARRRHR